MMSITPANLWQFSFTAFAPDDPMNSMARKILIVSLLYLGVAPIPVAFLAGWVSCPEPDRFWLRFGYLERVL